MAFPGVIAPPIRRLNQPHQAVALRIPSGHHRAPAWRADGAGAEGVGEAASLCGQRVQIGTVDCGMAIASQPVTGVVAGHEQNIGRTHISPFLRKCAKNLSEEAILPGFRFSVNRNVLIDFLGTLLFRALLLFLFSPIFPV